MDSGLFAFFLPIALAIMMMGLGLELSIKDFLRVARYPKVIFIPQNKSPSYWLNNLPRFDFALPHHTEAARYMYRHYSVDDIYDAYK